MFPALTEVFSPVPRQFVRINVGNFRNPTDTRRAVLARLLLSDQEEVVPHPAVTEEIHKLTGGNPYEVMLVSHFALRESRQGVPMELTAGALEKGGGELFSNRTPASRQPCAGFARWTWIKH